MENTNELPLEALQSLFNFETPTETKEDTDTTISDFIETEETVEDTPPTPPSTEPEIILNTETDSFKLAKLLINSGELEDITLELEDGQEQKLSEFSNIDEETLKQVLKSYREEQEELKSKDFIKVKGLTETQQKLINIVSQGNYKDLQEIFENPESLREPWEGYDSTNEVHNEKVYMTHLINVQNLSVQQAEALLKIAKENLTLDVEAEKFVNQQREIFKKDLENKEKELAEKKKQEVESKKQFSKDLSEKFKTMDLKPEVALAMVKTATQSNPNQSSTALDDLYKETLKDVNKASELILFLTNKEIYDAKIKSQTKLEEQVDYAKKIKIVRDTKNKTTVEDTTTTKTTDDVLKDIFSIQ